MAQGTQYGYIFMSKYFSLHNIWNICGHFFVFYVNIGTFHVWSRTDSDMFAMHPLTLRKVKFDWPGSFM